ncbi:MAG TPA: DNA repair protein RecO [Methylomirabilota bacterium]|nr:DNA repair protein RecO [Methylomirabilota bacterium]
MGLGRSAAVVLGSFPLGESDRVVTFFTREHGKLRGVARRARRLSSRFGSALELFTHGELVFFDGGRSDLVQVDHFDITRPFAGVREDLETLGQAAWMAECVTRLTAERDPNPAVYGLFLRALASVEAGAVPARVALAFGLRCIDALGHRLRTDRCVACGARGRRMAAIGVDTGGTLCPSCARGERGVVPVGPPALALLERLRRMAWAEAVGGGLGAAGEELRTVLEAQVAHLIGQPTRASRFLREVVGARTTAMSPGELP